MLVLDCCLVLAQFTEPYAKGSLSNLTWFCLNQLVGKSDYPTARSVRDLCGGSSLPVELPYSLQS